MNRDEIKISQSVLFISHCLLLKSDKEINEKFLLGTLTRPEDSIAPIAVEFRKKQSSTVVSDGEICALFFYSLKIWGDYDHFFRNLWGANGQIAATQLNIDAAGGFTIGSDSKKALKIKTLKIASSKKFWNFTQPVNDNLLRGVVYDSDTGLQIVNQEVFEEHIGLYCETLNSDAKDKDIKTKIKLAIVQNMIETYSLLNPEEEITLKDLKPKLLDGELLAKKPDEPKLNLNVELIKPEFRIMYGPPGTGKTRKAKQAAGEVGDENCKIVQIHPSSSYEDIVEGIRPVSFSNGDLKYEVVDGPIKIMAHKARGDHFNTLCSLKLNNEKIEIGLPLGTTLRYGLENCLIHFPGYQATEAIKCSPPKSDTFVIDTALFKSKFENIFTRLSDMAGSQALHFERISIKDTNWGTSNKYLLILDEVNRGNVASILGEMIFVISEMDSDQEDRKKVTLQYSNEEFGWPNKLSLIGTMNSTDISIDRIDQAIKRRFEFESVDPDSSVFEKIKFPFLPANFTSVNSCFAGSELSPNPGKIMDTINKALQDRAQNGYGAFNVKDKLIGHSYFIKFSRRICELIKKNDSNRVSVKAETAVHLEKILNNEIKAAMLNIFNGDRDQMEKFIDKEIPLWKTNFGMSVPLQLAS